MKLVTLEKDADKPWSLTSMLRDAGYHCRGYRNINELAESPWVEQCDLVVIDAQETKLDQRLMGYLAESYWTDRPMLFVGNEPHRPDALTRDIDAYLARPVSVHALVTAVKATLARRWDQYADSTAMQFGHYRFDADGHGVLMNQTHVVLTHKEYLLALLMFRNLGRPVSRVYLAETVWHRDERINARSMTAHVSTIRSKLALRAGSDYQLSPIYNYGYRLDTVRRQRTPGIAATQTLHP